MKRVLIKWTGFLAASPAASPERFGAFGRAGALAVVLALLGLIGLGLATGATPVPPKGGPPSNDSTLFLHVLDDLRNGEPYYAATVREQRAVGYPLKPFITVRLPTLAVAMALLPTPDLRRLLAGALSVVTLAAWAWRLRRWVKQPLSFSVAVIFLCGALLPSVLGDDYTFHELWSGDLIALSLAIYSRRTWPASLALACLALSIRELAGLYFVVMAALALRDGRRLEAGAWALGIAGLAIGLAMHAAAVQPLIQDGDLPSFGWTRIGGWPFILLLTKWNLLLMTVPDGIAAVIVPLALLGLVARRGVWEDRVTLVVAGYILVFLIVGRRDNSYWGLMIDPLWPVGLAASWPALTGLMAKFRPAARLSAPP